MKNDSGKSIKRILYFESNLFTERFARNFSQNEYGEYFGFCVNQLSFDP